MYESACMCVCTTFLQCPWRPEENVTSSRTELMDSSEAACGCWGLNQGPPGERVLLTAGPSLHIFCLFVVFFFNIGYHCVAQAGPELAILPQPC